MSKGFLILCGGKSRRMGFCKALALYKEKRFIDLAMAAGCNFSEKLVSINNNPGIDFAVSGFSVVKDNYENCGPLAGIEAALKKSTSKSLVVIPCDMPLLDSAFCDYLASLPIDGSDALVMKASNGEIHNLVGVYSKTCLPVLRASLESGEYRVSTFLSKVRTSYLDLPACFSQEVLCTANSEAELSTLPK